MATENVTLATKFRSHLATEYCSVAKFRRPKKINTSTLISSPLSYFPNSFDIKQKKKSIPRVRITAARLPLPSPTLPAAAPTQPAADPTLENRFKIRQKNNPDVPENDLWFELVEGFNKEGDVYGTGTARELYYNEPNSGTTASKKKTYMPDVVAQLQSTLEAEREERMAEKKARDEKEAKRDEEVRRMKEQMEMMTSYFSTCNPGWNPHSQDPKDPSGGGGSVAGATLPSA